MNEKRLPCPTCRSPRCYCACPQGQPLAARERLDRYLRGRRAGDDPLVHDLPHPAPTLGMELEPEWTMNLSDVLRLSLERALLREASPMLAPDVAAFVAARAVPDVASALRSHLSDLSVALGDHPGRWLSTDRLARELERAR